MKNERSAPIDDRRVDVLLERLDAIRDELRTLNRRLDSQDGLLRVSAELRALNESLQAIAYAALGHQPPQIRRRRGS